MKWKHSCPFLKIEKNVSQCWKKCPDSVHYWLKFTLSECSFKKSRKSTLLWEIPGCAPDIYTYIQTVNIRHTNISPLTTSGRICILVFCSNSAQWYLIRIKKLDENRILRKILLCPKIDLLLYFFGKILSIVFPGNSLKWKIFIFQRKTLIWQNSGCQVMGQKALSQSD